MQGQQKFGQQHGTQPQSLTAQQPQKPLFQESLADMVAEESVCVCDTREAARVRREVETGEAD